MKTILKQLRLCFASAAGLAVFLAAPAHAAVVVTLNPAAQVIGVGDSTTVTLNISGLDPARGLGGWLVNFTYDAGPVSIFSDYDNVIGTPGGSPDVVSGDVAFTAGYALSFQYSFAGGGVVEADETSFDAFTAPGPTSIDVAKFTFTGVAPGISNLVFTQIQLSDAINGATIADFGVPTVGQLQFSGATIEVTSSTNNVPDSGVTVPLAICLGAMMYMRRRNR